MTSLSRHSSSDDDSYRTSVIPRGISSRNSFRHRSVGRNGPSSYVELNRPYPLARPNQTRWPSPPGGLIGGGPSSSSSSPQGPQSRIRSPPTNVQRGSSADRFIPSSSSPVTLRHGLSSPTVLSPNQRDGSQSPTNPQRQIPGHSPFFTNTYQDELHSFRLAEALEVPTASKILDFRSQPTTPNTQRLQSGNSSSNSWDTHSRRRASLPPSIDHSYLSISIPPVPHRTIPLEPFRVLDAPGLRDDFYATPLSWSRTSGAVAVGLGDEVYLWDPNLGVRQLAGYCPHEITCVSFSHSGNILAVGRSDGAVQLWAPMNAHGRPEIEPRLLIPPLSSGPVGALGWRPLPRGRVSAREDLVTGGYDGKLSYYEIYWDRSGTSSNFRQKYVWLDCHDDQICGLAWSSEGGMWASGSNDNRVCLFDMIGNGESGDHGSPIHMGQIERKWVWTHEAAVKALAFRGGRGGVLATGGGANDKKIRFYNTTHGTLLHTLTVAAQITSLVWSPPPDPPASRSSPLAYHHYPTQPTELLATFGYTATGVETKVAVYSYPSLQCIVGFSMNDEIRALYCCQGPEGSGEVVVAGSDETVRFYKIWVEGRWNAKPGKGRARRRASSNGRRNKVGRDGNLMVTDTEPVGDNMLMEGSMGEARRRSVDYIR